MECLRHLKLGAGCHRDYSGRVKLLFIGDIVGQPGRRAVKELLPKLRQQHGINVVVANGENAAGGSGITVNTAQEIFDAGVDIMTSGDHLWDQKEVAELLANERIFRGGTAFLPDAGFTGPHESVIGREIEPIIQRFLTNMPQKFEVARGRVFLQGALIELDDLTGRAMRIVRVSAALPSGER